MTDRADFYVLPTEATDERGRFLCKVVEKVYEMGRRIHIHAPSESDADRLDQLLWEFRPDSFIPHDLLQRDGDAAITIGWGPQRPEHRDVFVNLELAAPTDALEFERIIEVVIQQPDILAATRNNYRLYQQQQVDIKMHDMRRQRAR